MRMFLDFSMQLDKACIKWNINNRKKNNIKRINNNQTKERKFKEELILKCLKGCQEY
jgi:hypothetical protein